MNTAKIVADGPLRFRRAKQKAAKESSTSIAEKYTTQIAQAASAEKQKVQKPRPMESEVRQRTLNHEPAPGSLW